MATITEDEALPKALALLHLKKILEEGTT